MRGSELPLQWMCSMHALAKRAKTPIVACADILLAFLGGWYCGATTTTTRRGLSSLDRAVQLASPTPDQVVVA
jgi:hypothetical protein